MVEYRNKKEERAQHQQKMRVLKKKYQPMLQLKEYELYKPQVIGVPDLLFLASSTAASKCWILPGRG